MDADYARQEYGTAVGHADQQKPQVFSVQVQGVPSSDYGVDGCEEWEEQSCWMKVYLVFSVVGIVGMMFTWPLVFGMILGTIAASFHVCSCCSACYGNVMRRGARIIQILAIIAAIVDVVLATLVLVLAALVAAASERYYYADASDEVMYGILIGAAIFGGLHAYMSILTARGFTRLIWIVDAGSCHGKEWSGVSRDIITENGSDRD